MLQETSKILRKLQRNQRSMEKYMLGFTQRCRKRKKWIRGQSKIPNAICKLKKLKWNLAEHLARRRDDRWITRVLRWIPRNKKRPRKQPQCRRKDHILKFVRAESIRTTEKRVDWKHLGWAFILKWIDNDDDKCMK